ncbi:aspartate aminotransferase family protein [Sphingobacteriales bacterium UPWRP_1]|nr:hypothetical protein BVG80_13320 [Sphingobacteriales bacterium TSM_CSM]PSJ77806.1 aspartate aminotransferase family protein [Sphingobacteriales bacterium UPWRP_1]
MKKKLTPFPSQGLEKEDLLNRLRAFKKEDARWKSGRTFAHIYNPGSDITDMVREAYNLFFSENALNPYTFPSLRKLENEVVSMAAHLLGGNEETSGCITNGGTESIFLALHSAREWAKSHHPVIGKPEVILPQSAHPAFHKACHYLQLQPVVVPLGADYKVNPAEAWKAITNNTIAIAGSAPAYPHGVIDHIGKLADLATENNLWLHVDACVGGFILPFARKLGHLLPDFDFTIPGVQSLSADLHKYGYAAKGASVLLYRNSQLRKYQLYTYTQWPGGIYASLGFGGTRAGGAIAAAWAAFCGIGEAGYLKLTEKTLQTVRRLRQGIEAMNGLKLVVQPDISILAITSDKIDVFALADKLTEKGWFVNRQFRPPSIHLTVSPIHAVVADEFLIDLQTALDEVQQLSINRIGNTLQTVATKGLKWVLPKKTFSKLQSLTTTGKPDPSTKNAAVMFQLLQEYAGDPEIDLLLLNTLDELYTNSE